MTGDVRKKIKLHEPKHQVVHMRGLCKHWAYRCYAQVASGLVRLLRMHHMRYMSDSSSSLDACTNNCCFFYPSRCTGMTETWKCYGDDQSKCMNSKGRMACQLVQLTRKVTPS